MSRPASKKGTKQRHKVNANWMKIHPLEGDGLIPGFFNVLHKRTFNAKTKTMKTCDGIIIPDTIVFDHNFPRGWYTTDMKAREITKRQGKELDASSIYSAFCKRPHPDVNIVASYMSSYEEEEFETGESVIVTQVEFFNEETLREFVARKSKREGILQKFLLPKGAHNNVIQAIWSVYIKTPTVERRTTGGTIKDKVQCDKDPYQCAVTYEGPSHFSEETGCAKHTTEQIRQLCESIKDHFLSVEQKPITRMVLYFKLDAQDQPWLLWCGSLRVGERKTAMQQSQPGEVISVKRGFPLNLDPRYISPSLEMHSPEKEDKLLLEADHHHMEMTQDRLFYSTFVRDVERAVDEANSRANSPTLMEREKTTNQKRREAQRREEAASLDAKKKSERENEEWKKLPGVQDQYMELCNDLDFVLSFMDDVFYEAYGHFLRHDPGPFIFQVDAKVADTMGIDVLQEVMEAAHIEHPLPTGEDTTSTIENEELAFVIQVHHPFGPPLKLGDCVSDFIREKYKDKEQELYLSVPQMEEGLEEEEQRKPQSKPERHLSTDSQDAPPQTSTPQDQATNEEPAAPSSSEM